MVTEDLVNDDVVCVDLPFGVEFTGSSQARFGGRGLARAR